MFAAREEAVIHCYNSVRQVAKQLQIDDAEWKSTDELLGDLAKKDAETHALLVKFLIAYKGWFEHHVDILTRKTATSEFEKGKMAGLIQARDIHRSDLLKRLKSLAGAA
jgi:hypothetical protein